MTPSEYQQRSVRTMKPGFDATTDDYFLGLVGEGGEVIDLLKKTIYHHHPVDRDKLCKECGDATWYIAAMATIYGFDLGVAYLAAESYFAGLNGYEPPPNMLCRFYVRICATIDEIRYGENAPDNWEAVLALNVGALLRIVEALAKHYDIALQEVFEVNVAKLLERYPDNYSHDASINRVV